MNDIEAGVGTFAAHCEGYGMGPTPKFNVGDEVTVKQTGYHRMDGKPGVVTYIRSTIGVSFDGDVYGFLPHELELAE